MIAALMLSLAPCITGADPEGEYLESGLYSEAKLTKDEMADLIYFSPSSMPDPVFDEEPSLTAPYAPGAVSGAVLSRTLDRLNMFRRISGLPAANLDAELCESAQYGAVLLAVSDFSHFPDQPEDMDDEFFALATEATSTCNIYAGRDLPFTPDGFMDDSNVSNISALGHRRWQLNPTLGVVGFGYAENPDSDFRKYTCANVFDTGGGGGDYDFISWPASGNFPNNLTAAFGINTAWSVTLNPERYQAPVLSELTVTITRESDGFEYVLLGTDSYSTSGGAYMNVDLSNYGVSNCIIFRPANSTGYDGLHTVRIDGIKNADGEPVDFAYQVDFFEATPYRDGPNEALNIEGGELAFFTGRDHPFAAADYEDRTVGVSGNAGIDDSESFLVAVLELNAGDTLSFDYRYSTEFAHDKLSFTVNGGLELRLSGESDGWQTYSVTVTSYGSYIFRWGYLKDEADEDTECEDVVMLDNIRLERAQLMMGDADGDGAVTSFDALLVLRYSLGLLHDIPNFEAADIDGNGVLESVDALVILRRSMGI